MDLRSLIAMKKLNLKPCQTVVTDTLGRRHEIVDGVKKELTRVMPFVVDEKPDLQVAPVVPGVFLSSQDPVVDIEILQRYEIRHVLSVGIDTNIKFDGIKYYHVELLDLPESNVLPPIEKCVRIIHENHRENVLVHCNAGVSRSPAIIIGYLMAVENLSYDNAYEKVKRTRNCIKPNEGFMRQLKSSKFSNILCPHDDMKLLNSHS